MPAPTSVHPKVAAGFVAGGLVAAVVAVLAAFGVNVPQGVSDFAVAVVGFVAGYFKPAS